MAITSIAFFTCMQVMTSVHWASCDLYLKTTGGQWEPDGLVFSCLFARTALPKAVADWAGIPCDQSFTMVPISEHRAIGYMSDDGVPWNEIADIIEKEL